MKNTIATFVIAAGAFYFPATSMSFGQSVLSSCNPATGLTPSGQQCVTLTPVEPTRYQTQISGEGAQNYNPVNVGQLAETYQCNPSGANANASAIGGALLIEDCGQPLDLNPATFQEFVGYSGTPAPAPIVPASAPVAPPPVVPTPVAPVAPAPIVAAAAPPAYAAVPFQAAGLSNAALVGGALGAAALVGLIAVVANDDDDDSSSTTTTTSP